MKFRNFRASIVRTKCSETEQIQTGNFSHVIGNDILPKILREQRLFTIFGNPVLLNDNFKRYMFVVIFIQSIRIQPEIILIWQIQILEIILYLI